MEGGDGDCDGERMISVWRIPTIRNVGTVHPACTAQGLFGCGLWFAST